MKIFIAGATGVLGWRCVTALRKAGHQVVGLARSPENEKAIKELGGTPRRADLFDKDSLVEAAKGCDVVIHAATGLKRQGRFTKKAKARVNRKQWGLNDLVRREGTRRLAEAASEVGAKRFVLQSIAWLVRPDDGSEFDETSPPNAERSTASALLAERTLAKHAADSGFEATVLRFGYFYAHDSVQTRFFAEGLARGMMGPLGKGKAPWSMIHADDAASAMVAAVKGPQAGTFHVVDERPVSSLDFMKEIADRLGARPPRPVPAAAGLLMAGRTGLRFFTKPMRTNNKAFKKATGWKPKYVDYKAGLDEVFQHWKKEGFPKNVKPPKEPQGE